MGPAADRLPELMMNITRVWGKPVWKNTDGDYYIFYTGINIYIVKMSCPFIIGGKFGAWIVGPGWPGPDSYRVGIASVRIGLATPPRSGWRFIDRNSWVLDDTLLFLPGGPGKEF